MSILNKTLVTRVLLLIAFILGITLSCKKKDSSSDYIKALSDMAARFNKNCPKDEANGTVLESVTFSDNTLVFRLSLTDEAIANIDLESARDSLVMNVSDKLKKFLVKGNCNMEYKYISPNDSSSITIIPNEFGVSENYNDK